VLAVRKRQRSFVNMITIGRAQNNDVVIPDISVSKFHAYFRVPPDGIRPSRSGVDLCDSDSSNGTWVNDVRIASKESVFIHVGSVLRFGAVALTLEDAARLWDRVHRLRQVKSTIGA
jgi:pSer/pThr/pTyr-binding forkhead associated (FHA) protein